MHYHRHYPGTAQQVVSLSLRLFTCPAWSAFLSFWLTPPSPRPASYLLCNVTYPSVAMQISCFPFATSIKYVHWQEQNSPLPISCSTHVISTLHDNDTILTKLIMHNLNIFLAHCSCSCSYCINPHNQPGGNSSDILYISYSIYGTLPWHLRHGIITRRL